MISSLSAINLFGADIIPASNRVDWASVAGVEGGIRYRSTIYTNLTLIDNTGATDVKSGVQTAINNCTSNAVVKLPAGIFRMDSSLAMKSSITLRGSGPGVTFVIPVDEITFNDGGGKANVNASSGYTRGSTSIVLADTPANLVVGSSILFNELNDVAFVTACGFELEVPCDPETYLDEPDGGLRIRGQLLRVTGIAGTTIDFLPALHWTFTAGLTPRIHYPASLDSIRNMETYAGIEDLTLTNNGSTMVRFENAQNCWLSNVTFNIAASDTPSVQGFYSHRIEVRHCHFVGYSATASAIVPFSNNEGWLVEDNIFQRVNQSFIVVGRGGGHVFAYNYTESITNGTAAMIGEIGNHGGHPQFVLLEGNKIWKFHNDSIHGSSSHWTLWRNNIKGRKPGSTFGHGMVWIDHTNWYNSVVGNVMGYVGIETNDVGGFTVEYESDGTGTDDNNPDNIVEFAFGRSGYNNHTIDTKAKSTTLRHGNYSFLTLTTNWDAGIAERNIPASLLHAFKPSYFGSLTWPPIGPDTTGYYTNHIPAEYRLLTGQEVPVNVTTKIVQGLFNLRGSVIVK